MAYTFSRTVKIGKKLKTKRTPWKPRDLRDINLYSTESKARELRKADLMRHSRYSENGTETIEVRDKQSDPSDISTYQINQLKDGSSANFYEGSTGNDILEGGNGDDYLQGLEGDDVLTGNSGNDFLDGGKGMDTLIGGEGGDYFRIGGDTIIASSDLQSYDWITDFNGDQGDKIVIKLSQAQQTTANTSGSATVQISSNPDQTDRLFSQGATFAYELSTGRLLAGSALFGGSSVEPIVVAMLNGNPTATTDDFIITT
jgi:Ca2+-binding RTX toxin-like protein